MKNNELIAEFMCVPQGSHTHFMIEPFALESYADVDDLKYDISWDWLMPVIDKCYQEHMSKHIADAVMTCDKDKAYQAVIEFINEYNKTI